MQYTMTTPCDECPFLKKLSHGFTMTRLRQFTFGEFPCHKTAEEREHEDGGSDFIASDRSLHCAGALIFMEKRGITHQMLRITERLGLYDRTKLNIKAKVR